MWLRGLALLGSMALLAVGLPATAAQAAPQPRLGDIDGDGRPETIVGLRDAVDVYLTSTGARQRVTHAWLGFAKPSMTDFGEAFAVGDLNGDGYADLAVGASEEGLGNALLYGTVYVSYGSATGLTRTGAVRLTGDRLGFDAFGAALAFVTTDEATFLAVGAPDGGVGGEVALLRQGTTGIEVANRFQGGARELGSPAMAWGDGFGSKLAADGNLLVIGAPGKVVSGRSSAGAVAVVTVTGATPTVAGVTLTQNSPGIPGGSETYDHFGEAVAVRDGIVAIGVPGEKLGTAAVTGMIQLLRVDPATGGVTALSAYHQDSAGVPGGNESGDAFGSSIALLSGFACAGELAVAVGAPGENLESASNAGSVTLIVPGKPSCNRSFSQGTGGLGGSRESGDQVGRTLGVVRDPAGAADALLVGAPEEDLSGYRNAGVAHSLRRTSTGWSRRTFSGGGSLQFLGWSLGGTFHVAVY